VARVLGTNPPGLVEEGSVVSVYHTWPCGRCGSCRRGDEPLCRAPVAWMGFTHPGGFQERVVAPVDRLVASPAGIDPVLAAPLSCAIGTAFRAVVTRGGVVAGTRVVVVGLGGVGIHAAQIALAAGADATGIDRHSPSVEAARELGIDAHLPHDAIATGTHQGRGVDVVIDTVGHHDTLTVAATIVREGGRIVGVGYAPKEQVQVPTLRWVLGELELVGSRYASRADLAQAALLVERGAVRPIVGLVRPLEDVNQVFEALVAGDLVGRAVLEVTATSQPDASPARGLP
jgi:D-arabinose 1-dehydrogenase-like Zn-dependent alcohol dehydrogenase